MASRQIPKVMRKLVATKLGTNFRECTGMVETAVPQPGPMEVLVRNRFVGINASDINYTAGRYDPSVQPPFDVGFEGLGEVVSVGEHCLFKPGQPVLFMNGAFTEYKLLPSKWAIPVPELKPEFLPLLVSGLTAAISLDKVGDIKAGETVLITAAAGGTGQFAVQWAKQAGCHVIGTCSSPEKVEMLKSLGCDRPVNYKAENLKEVLKKEYPKGVDVVYESIGGDMFDLCLNSLAVKGRLIVIGFISGYESQAGFKASRTAGLAGRLLAKSTSVRGFFLMHYVKDFAEYLMKLVPMVQSGEMKSVVDYGHSTPHGPFRELDSVADAVEYLYTGRSSGKIVVELNAGASSKL